jgi:hypothetical protein
LAAVGTAALGAPISADAVVDADDGVKAVVRHRTILLLW